MVGGKEDKRESTMTELHPFKWRHFEAEIILLCVRWYLRYGLSYPDLEEIMRERRLAIDHTTIYRLPSNATPQNWRNVADRISTSRLTHGASTKHM
jgi:IS6 family transposase